MDFTSPTPEESDAATGLSAEIRACRICATRFAATATRHSPRPVAWFRASGRILVAGQAPGLRVHEAQKPFWDASGVRLRSWMGVTEEEFYDLSRIAVVPMAFCFPGYDAKGSDLPPPPICAATWRLRVMATMPDLNLLLLVGGAAQRWHLGKAAAGGVTATVAQWHEFAPRIFPLPHPSWRNTGWLKRNPWFEAELVPELRLAVRRELDRGLSASAASPSQAP